MQTPINQQLSPQPAINPENLQSEHKQEDSILLSPQPQIQQVDSKSDVDSPQEKVNYYQLTCKLQSALKKISSTKKMATFSGSETPVMSRFKQFETMKKKKIQQKLEQSQLKQSKTLQDRPNIDRNSNKIITQMGHTPIHLRTQQMMKNKQKRLQEYQNLKKEKQEQQQRLFLEQYNKHVKRPQQLRSYESYFQQQVRWDKRKKQQAQAKHQQKMKKQIEGLTFKPEINARSKKLLLVASQKSLAQKRAVKPKKTSSYVLIDLNKKVLMAKQ